MAKKKTRKPKTSDAPADENAPTPERIAKGEEAPKRSADGSTRLLDWPLSRLFARKTLHSDGNINLALFESGERIYSAYVAGGLHGVKAVDLNALSGAKMSARGMPFSPAQAMARDEYRKIVAVLDEDARAVVIPICVHGSRLEDVGREVSGYADEKQARAVALDRLRRGLRAVAELLGYMGAHEIRRRREVLAMSVKPESRERREQAARAMMDRIIASA